MPPSLIQMLLVIQGLVSATGQPEIFQIIIDLGISQFPLPLNFRLPLSNPAMSPQASPTLAGSPPGRRTSQVVMMRDSRTGSLEMLPVTHESHGSLEFVRRTGSTSSSDAGTHSTSGSLEDVPCGIDGLQAPKTPPMSAQQDIAMSELVLRRQHAAATGTLGSAKFQNDAVPRVRFRQHPPLLSLHRARSPCQCHPVSRCCRRCGRCSGRCRRVPSVW